MRFIKVFTISFLIMLIAEISSFIIASQFKNNDINEIFIRVDVQIITMMILILYSLMFSILDKINPIKIHVITTLNIIALSYTIVHSYLFYSMRIDWLSINDGLKELTPYQSIVRSDFVAFGGFISSLIACLVLGFFDKYKDLNMPR